MLSILAIAAARSSPRASADGSLNEVDSVAVDAGTGVGVAGGCADAEIFVAAGAAGAAGVDDVCAGVEGSVGFGAGFGCILLSVTRQCASHLSADLRRHAHDEAFLLDLVRLDGVIILQNLARVDQLLLCRFPAFLLADLLLHRANCLCRLGINGKFLLLQVLERELHRGRMFDLWTRIWVPDILMIRLGRLSVPLLKLFGRLRKG